MFGLAYDEDVDALVKRLNELKGEYENGISTVETQQSQLRSLTSSELNSQKTHMNKVMKMADEMAVNLVCATAELRDCMKVVYLVDVKDFALVAWWVAYLVV